MSELETVVNQPVESEQTESQEVEETTTGAEDFDLFGEDDSENTNETIEDPAEEKVEEPKVEVPTSFLKVKYNGEEKELSQEDAIIYAQKGMNYDKLQTKLDNIVNSKELTQLNRLAAESNMSVEEFVTQLDKFSLQTKVNNVMAQLRSQYPNSDDELLQKMAIEEVSKQREDLANRESIAEQQAREQHDNELKSQIDEMHTLYPDVDLTQLPQEVIDDIAINNHSIVQAYLLYDNKQLKAKYQAINTNQKNTKRSMGNVSTNVGNENSNDPFLGGLLG